MTRRILGDTFAFRAAWSNAPTIAVVAAKFGVSVALVVAEARRFGYADRPDQRRCLRIDDTAEFRALWDDADMSFADIAEKMGMSVRAIKTSGKRHGYGPRSTPRKGAVSSHSPAKPDLQANEHFPAQEIAQENEQAEVDCGKELRRIDPAIFWTASRLADLRATQGQYRAIAQLALDWKIKINSVTWQWHQIRGQS